MRRILFATMLLLLTAAASLLGSADRANSSQENTVFSGRVVDDADDSPIPGAVVVLDGTSFRATTRGNGAYQLTVPASAIRTTSASLVARATGYASAAGSVKVAGGVAFHDFRLMAAEGDLEQLDVVGDGDQGGRVLNETVESRSADALRPPLPAAPPSISMSSIGYAPGGVGSMTYMRGPGGDWNTESYDFIQENGFRSATENPLSTFSIDVDRASYSNVRRFLLDGQLPPKDAVRIEEMINYFPYDYPRSRGQHPFGVGVEVGEAPWRSGHLLMRVGLASPRVEMESLPANNLVFLLDVSGSMQSPDKLPLVKTSLRMLVNELRSKDRVAIVVYAGAAGLVLPSTPGNQKTRILSAIEELEAGGSTAGGEGLRLAYRIARENYVADGNNRVVLATDGDFNVGVSSDAEMIRLVEERRGQGTFLTVLGFGSGNLKDSKMEQMADHGNGNYAYIDSLLEARKVLVSEMGGTLLTVASDVKLQIEFNPEQVRAYRLIGYENRLLAAEDFNDDTKDAGELGAGHTVTALYEIVPVGVETDVEIRGVDPLRYQAPEATPARSPNAGDGELGYVKVRYKKPGSEASTLLEQPVAARVASQSADFTFASAVAGFGMLLRDSEFRGDLTADRVLALARAGKGDDAEGYRAEFVRLVEIYRGLARGE